MIDFFVGTITKAVRAAGNIVRVTISGRPDETLSSRKVWQQYGFSSVPPDNSDCLVLRVGNLAVCFATESADHKPTGAWVAAMYADKDTSVQMFSDGSIKIAGGKVTIQSDLIELGGNAKTVCTSDLIAALQNHTHLFVGQGTVQAPPPGTFSGSQTTDKVKV